MKLVIVESPAKAKTIEKFLGAEYTVIASYGHIRDLPSSADEIPAEFSAKPWARLAVDVDNDFRPIYVTPASSRRHVDQLKKALKKADELLLASDEDREGEAISWHLLQELQPKVPVRRITFHEITRPAIMQALREPREVDENLVRSQESRRILDRLFGYTLSPVLWKKVRTKLSAGRVQSVALRLVVEREEERMAFKSASYFDVEATLQSGPLEFKAALARIDNQPMASGRDFDPQTGALKAGSNARALTEDEAHHIARTARRAVPWHVTGVERKETIQRPAPPFTTSTLQQAASSQLHLPPRQTMQIAQRLYEGVDLNSGEREGLITYMRTDSVTLSQKALDDAAELIRSKYGDAYHTGPRQYKTKAKGAQEAHEAIRPTDMRRTPEMVAPYLQKSDLALYRLIWTRAVASQMADARLDKTTVEITAQLDGKPHVFRANGSIVRFAGFLQLFGERQKDTLLPEMHQGEAIGAAPGDATHIATLEAIGRQTMPPARFSEAALVKKLEEEGIGRPSTYAPTLSTIESREYVVKKNSALVPTFLGMAVVSLLRRHFAHYIDIGFTANMEETLDEIASGNINYVDFLRRFYQGAEGETGLLRQVEESLPQIDFPSIDVGVDPETSEPITVRVGRNSIFVQRGDGGDGNRATLPIDMLIDDLTLEKALELIETRSKGQEPLGQDPETGMNVYALIGAYGPYLQLGETEEGNKPKRASLPRGVKPQDVTIEEALRLLSLPRDLGVDPETGKRVVANLGRFGPYVECNRTFASVPALEQCYTIGLDEALDLIAAKKKKTLLREMGDHPTSGLPMTVNKGKFGPYVTDTKVNASLPKGLTPEALTVEEAVALLAAAAERKKTAPAKGGRKKAAAKAPAKKATAKKAAPKKTAAKKTAVKKAAAKKSASPASED